MKHCPTCGGTRSVLTPEARQWLSASGAEQATLPKPESHDRFVACPSCARKGVKLDAYEVLEEGGAGHRLTMVGPLMAGRTPYCCERCGAFVLIASGGELLMFHAPLGSSSTQDMCTGKVLPEGDYPLRERLAKLPP